MRYPTLCLPIILWSRKTHTSGFMQELHSPPPAGQNLGTLCVIDREPRELSTVQQKALQALGRQVMTQLELRRHVLECDVLFNQLQDAVKEVKILSGFVPICANCKVMRNDRGEWVPLEISIHEQSQARCTHGVCPACKKDLLSQVADFKPMIGKEAG